MHEAQLHGQETCFVTLTYSDEHLPADNCLSKRDFQLFFKRLRKRISGGVRFLGCGEYGEENWRPHYHALLFGWRPTDLQVFFRKNGRITYTSECLASIWKLGHCTVGDVSLESASYVAQYVLKKQDHMQRDDAIDKSTGVIWRPTAPFLHMSRNPGLGAGWFEKFGGDVFPRDECILNGRHFKVPRFYDNRLKDRDPETFADVKAQRKVRSQDNPNFSPERLRAKERIVQQRIRERRKRNAEYSEAVQRV